VERTVLAVVTIGGSASVVRLLRAIGGIGPMPSGRIGGAVSRFIFGPRP
jgi:hypothetical protein